ncbi:SGNH/GDSL hydrolase family protein [Segetibacter sp. 3557_3]|uniref:SGNH/GDSL hydrolase family protein n=1 Tax=Segetibacter sp. 3557_3 TaxID=2547429 RepID=UPI001058D567|nr:SGNH/GDSL hydrolase family protein [Segetibacter sp. 3557_3]TDH27000.1 SGNH/GDSL hydrolase family protein [Segetibacter sp. 3557_3]
MIRNKRVCLSLLAVTSGLIWMSFKQESKVEVVCFGDSITYGANVNGHSWVWLLSRANPSINFINAGRSGRKTADKQELLPVLDKYPDAGYYLIFLGVNDLKDGNDSMVTTCVNNMKWMIGQIRKTAPGAKIIVLSPADINVETMSEVNVKKMYNVHTHESLQLLDKRYRALAKQEDVQFISLLDVVAKPNYADGLHPNESGQQEIADRVWKHLRKQVLKGKDKQHG